MLTLLLSFFFFNDTATTEIYTLSLHDALPICAPGGRRDRRPRQPAGRHRRRSRRPRGAAPRAGGPSGAGHRRLGPRSEEHTSELQSRQYLVCRLLLEKKQLRVRYHSHGIVIPL